MSCRKNDNKIEIPELVEVTKKLYKELGKKYGIVAPVDFTTSKDNNGRCCLLYYRQGIEGKHLNEVNKSENFR